MAAKKIRVYLALIFFIPFCYSICAIESTIPTASLKANDIIYNEAIYRINQNGYVLKLNPKGHTIWQLKHPTPATQIKLLFNQLIVIDKAGGLYNFDAAYGFLNWKLPKSQAQAIDTAYTYLILLTQDHHLTGLDLRTGLTVWKNTDLNFYSFQFDPKTQRIIARSDKNQIFHIQPDTGRIVKTQ